MIIVPPALYDEAQKQGVDMRHYHRSENLPTAADTRPRQITLADILKNGNRRARRYAMRKIRRPYTT